MTQLSQACLTILDQLENAVIEISECDFSKPSLVLSNSTMGQHLRHTLEFFICLESGFKNGVVNYDKRAHDKLIETDKFTALSSIQRIKDFVSCQKEDQPLKLEVGYEKHTEECVTIETNYLRELTYNIEHAVHHMAIMKIGIREVASYVTLPSDFGIAVSTLRHKETVQVL
jgi:uncharacterized damage-inducible protein DinB